MRKLFTKLFAASLILVTPQIAFAKVGPNYPEGFTPKTTSGISFTENKGQVCDQNYKPRPDVLFGAMAGNMAFHLKTTGVSYQLYRVDKYKEVEDERTKEKRKEIDQQTIYRIDLNWINGNENFTTTTDQTLEGYNNYYLESCPTGALNVKSYTGVTLHKLYNGINLHYYEKAGQLKHDYIVAPNTDYKQIQLKVEGASVSINEDGSLLLTTPLGKIQEGAPIVYQNGKILKAKWIVDNNTLSFEIENYNANLELIIDPITRFWGTYYGGSEWDDGNSCATDTSGNVYMAGRTASTSSTVIATAGAHQTAYGGGSYDAFLVKFNSGGVRQWGTYYGGTEVEQGLSCATDATGNVYMAGSTLSTSSTVIATAGAHQTVHGGGVEDGFLVKFNSSGVRQWGTYYGGSGNDWVRSCATDATGNVYFTGYTSSNTGTVIATAGAHQTTNGGGAADAFLVKFNSSGVRQWGTYYGTAGYEEGYSCATDATGNAYLAGNTDYNTGIATAGAHQTVYGGSSDAFLVKFNSSGVRQWGTYYGGTGTELGGSCATDATGNVYLAGRTSSYIGTVIATTGAHQTVNSGYTDAFLVKFNSSGVRQWGTYYGGIGDEFGQSCATDATGNVYLAGNTTSNAGTVIATTGSHQTTNGGGIDAFLVKFNSSGVRQWGTYYGGSGIDGASYCSNDARGNVYLAGNTEGNIGTVIATAGSHQTVYGGGIYDAFLVKFFDCVSLSPRASISDSVCAGDTINLSVSITGTATPTYSWTGPNSYTASVKNPRIPNADTVHIGTYTVTVNNAGCVETATTNLTTIKNPTAGTDVKVACGSYTWPLNSTTYTSSTNSPTVTITNAAGCDSVITLDLTINNSTISTISATVCDRYVSPSTKYTWTASGTYKDTIPNHAGCDSVMTINLTIKYSSSSSQSITACDSYTWSQNSQTYTTSGAYKDTITNTSGCDSIITLNLTIKNSSSSSQNITACDSYTWPQNSQTYTTSGAYKDTIANTSGCDSVITLNLTINNSSTGTDLKVACDSYTWPLNNVTYTSSTNTPTVTLTNAVGCDSVVTLNLTIKKSTAGTDVKVACISYTWPLNNITYTSSTNTPTVTLTNAAGCDSVVTLNLTINSVAVSVTNTSPTLTANATGATYQWLNCGNSFAAVNGATNKSYTATANGSYAVEVKQNGCIDTSTCQAVNNVGVLENSFGNTLTVYPNPTNGELSIDLGLSYTNVTVIISNTLGQVVHNQNFSNSNLLQINIPGEAGVYFIEVRSSDKKALLKVIKE